MTEKQVVVKNPHGLHARPAALFVQKAASFPCKSTILKEDGKQGDAKSILGVMSLGIEPGVTITIRAEGEREAEAVEALAAIAEDTTV